MRGQRKSLEVFLLPYPNLAGSNCDHDIVDPTLQRRDDLGVQLFLIADHVRGIRRPFSASWAFQEGPRA
jgi:hypothetical protein